ncbi:1-deoxy-D-xylulose 5-phosphate reductoisomerase [Candidatus Erwinia haradaeae]|uniref:1-deoxy-D-xylulose 5-phosphate reductoisomerase n=1 Tax=Candidatus Erwinia haradaeae TaxID=1922217 RepID=A0A451DCI3_9GAMM|nr:1-deoxy-D-xylulose-5-phosphate reductoisomerase [Candidatus Erwinia haradaeae]VFP84096.1 1-deoxy-D-xylulose 5-phosphate reductoisomerase [Candidatus Erwinia haradaeae]
MKQLTILGSTGSIGNSTLSVIRENPQLFSVKALVAGRNIKLMTQQCLEFCPDFAVMVDEESAHELRCQLNNLYIATEVLSGNQAACDVAALDDVDQVVAAIVGVAGLLPTLSAVRAGKQVLLANKESLVTCGRLFFEAVHSSKAHILPIDSEHNAIFQSLPLSLQEKSGYYSLECSGIDGIVLTGSGGPFRETPLSRLRYMTPNQACAHPNWLMGRKISVDSATMMNKGLEYIAARWLFNATHKQIEVIIHPQSVIHSMVRYLDGSVIAQLASPDMRIPIAYAMGWPQRVHSGASILDFKRMASLTFLEPDYVRYPCLQLAIEASQVGQAATTILNASNEVAVAAFLSSDINFTDIFSLNIAVLDRLVYREPTSIEEVLAIDCEARSVACMFLQKFMTKGAIDHVIPRYE